MELAQTGAKLEATALSLLTKKDIVAFKGPYNELWDLMESLDEDPIQLELAARVANVAYEYALHFYNSRDIFGVCSVYNDLRASAKSIQTSLELSQICVRVATGVFELKFQYREYENVNSYIDELLPITARFKDEEDFTLESAACLCNLLQLCPYDREVYSSRMCDIFERATELSTRFPENPELQLCVLHTMVFFVCSCKRRVPPFMYSNYLEKTKDTLTANKSIIESGAYNELVYSLNESGISL